MRELRCLTKYCRFFCLVLTALTIGIVQAQGASTPSQNTGTYPAQSTPPFTTYMPLVMKQYPPPPPIFGVHMSTINNTNGLQQAIDGGARWVRQNAFDWDRIEPMRTNPPTYRWEFVDQASLQNAAQNGLTMIAIIQFAPSWAQQYPGSACGPIHQDQFDEFAQFLSALVNRYKNPPYNVKYWEIGNEPDAPRVYERVIYGCWGQPGDPYYGGRYYGEMLKHAYPAIKAADPAARVLIGGLLLDCDPDHPPAGKDCTSSRFLEGILQAGGGPYFDTVSFHAYTYYIAPGQMTNGNWPGSTTAVPQKVAFLRSVLGGHGYSDKGLMNTEAALLCTTATSYCFDMQGVYVPRAYTEALSLGLQAQVYFDMRGTWRYSGLLQPDLTPKPVYYTYQAAAARMSQVEYIGPASGYPAGVQGYTFRKNDLTGYVDVIWTASGQRVVVILPSGATAYDRYGTPVSTPGMVELIYAPVYVERP